MSVIIVKRPVCKKIESAKPVTTVSQPGAAAPMNFATTGPSKTEGLLTVHPNLDLPSCPVLVQSGREPPYRFAESPIPLPGPAKRW